MERGNYGLELTTSQELLTLGSSGASRVGVKVPSNIQSLAVNGNEYLFNTPGAIVRESRDGRTSSLTAPKGYLIEAGSSASSTLYLLPTYESGSGYLRTFYHIQGQAGWHKITVPFSPLSFDVVTENDWWAIGGIPHNIVGKAGAVKKTAYNWYLYHTSDAGKQWTRYRVGGPIAGSVSFVGPKVGYVLEQNIIYRTTNGGSTFTGLKIPGAKSCIQFCLGPNQLSFSSASRGYMLNASGSMIFVTNDGGNSWQELH